MVSAIGSRPLRPECHRGDFAGPQVFHRDIAKAGRAHGECAMSQLAFGGSLFTSSGHRSSINSRIGSEIASMCLKSRTSLWMRSISAEWMIRPSKTRATHSGVSSWSLRPILRRMW
jgi:hypothetical protein